MISPKEYSKKHKNKSYLELLEQRNALYKEINEFEAMRQHNTPCDSSSEVIYQTHLYYLTELCKLISNAYNREFNPPTKHWLFILQEALRDKFEIQVSVQELINKRKQGDKFPFKEHLRALIYSLLSSNVKWNRIEPHLSDIDEIFFDYDVERIKEHTGEYFATQICKIKCGNLNIERQMNSLHKNIETMERIASQYGSMDTFVTSKPVLEIVKSLSNRTSEYKLHCVGEPLASQYLINVGIYCVKPDVHLCRFLSGNRMGEGNHSPATSDEVYQTAKRLSETTGISITEIDNLVWLYCADGYEEICTLEPKCSSCAISQFCNKPLE